jgi:hypothetical protein
MGRRLRCLPICGLMKQEERGIQDRVSCGLLSSVVARDEWVWSCGVYVCAYVHMVLWTVVPWTRCLVGFDGSWTGQSERELGHVFPVLVLSVGCSRSVTLTRSPSYIHICTDIQRYVLTLYAKKMLVYIR